MFENMFFRNPVFDFQTEYLLYDFLPLVHCTQGKLSEAKPLYERCQQIMEKVLGPEHPSLAMTLNNRAMLLESQVRAIRRVLEHSSGRGEWVQTENKSLVVGKSLLNNRAELLRAQVRAVGNTREYSCEQEK